MNEQEQHIIELLKQQDKRSIELLYDLYAPALFGIILKIVRSEHLAEDVLQEVFVKVWKYGSTYEAKKSSLFTWLLNIARNTAIDQTRSASFRWKSNRETLEALQQDHGTYSITPRPEHIGLRDLVNGLDAKYREIIDMIYFQGFTQQEVTEKLNLPLGTVKSRTRIAIRELRKFFKTQEVGLSLIIILLSIG